MTPPPFPLLRHRIHITKGDLLGVRWHLALRQKSIWIVSTLLTGLIAYTMFTGKHAPEDPYAVPSQIFVLLLFWLFWPLSLAAFSCLTSVATAARQPGILGLHDYEVREDGLLEKTDVNESLSRWAGIQSVKETRSHLLIWQSPGLIHVIPRRSFADPGTCRRFAELVRQKAEDAKRH